MHGEKILLLSMQDICITLAEARAAPGKLRVLWVRSAHSAWFLGRKQRGNNSLGEL